MVHEPSYIIHLNIRHYRTLLDNPATPPEMRHTLTALLGEAHATLAEIDRESAVEPTSL